MRWTGPVVRMTVADHHTALTIRTAPGPDLTIALDCAPDRRRAGAVTAGLRRLLHVRFDVRGVGVERRVTADLTAIGGRREVERSIPVPAALALTQGGVFTLVCLDDTSPPQC